MDQARREAEHFVARETAYHLGSLLTEQPHPLTRGLAETIAVDTRAGIAMLQAVDADVTSAARRVFASAEYAHTVELLTAAVSGGGRVCFSGCGATGRLSILLEAAWRAACGDRAEALLSLMTGGDYALIRSVESFEDYQSFGREQVREAGLGRGDLLVAVTEGGETSSVIGTVWQALESGAEVVFACNNPLDTLARQVERSRQVIADPRVVKLDLSSGPMAIAGSTRMQATTVELLVLGAALESALPGTSRAADDAERFAALLEDLSRPAAVAAMAEWVEREEAIYRAGGAVTYFADACLLDIFTDTTERSPTFNLPPFRRCDDTTSPRPWAFVKCPFRDTAQTWLHTLGREPRCLTWDRDTYRRLGAAEAIAQNPPALGAAELHQFRVGCEPDPTRWERPEDTAVLVVSGGEAGAAAPSAALGGAFAACSESFGRRAVLSVGAMRPEVSSQLEVCHIPCELPPSPLRLWEHLALKLVLNTISTATAARLGRVVSNWMAYVETTNKKLIDRGTRLVAELAGLSYAEACYELHRVRAELSAAEAAGSPRRSPVAETLRQLGRLPPAGQR